MNLKFFNIVLSKEAYSNNMEMQEGLINSLLNICVNPIGFEEVDFIDVGSGETVYTALKVRCVEMVEDAMKIFKRESQMNEIEYEGLPTLI